MLVGAFGEKGQDIGEKRGRRRGWGGGGGGGFSMWLS